METENGAYDAASQVSPVYDGAVGSSCDFTTMVKS